MSNNNNPGKIGKHEWENLKSSEPKPEKIAKKELQTIEATDLLSQPIIETKPQGKRGLSPRKTETTRVEKKAAALAEPAPRLPSPALAVKLRNRKVAAQRQESPVKSMSKESAHEVKPNRPTDSENDHLLDLVD